MKKNEKEPKLYVKVKEKKITKAEDTREVSQQQFNDVLSMLKKPNKKRGK